MNKEKQRQQHVINHLLLSDSSEQIALGKLLATGIMDLWEAWNANANWQTAEQAAENMTAIMTVAATMVSVTAAQNYPSDAHSEIAKHLGKLTRLLLKCATEGDRE